VSKSDRERFDRSIDEWNKTSFVMVGLGVVFLVLFLIGVPRWLLFVFVGIMAVVGIVRVAAGRRRVYPRKSGRS
jgi:hypothetical protein